MKPLLQLKMAFGTKNFQLFISFFYLRFISHSRDYVSFNATYMSRHRARPIWGVTKCGGYGSGGAFKI